jgi:hypothetical protein
VFFFKDFTCFLTNNFTRETSQEILFFAQTFWVVGTQIICWGSECFPWILSWIFYFVCHQKIAATKKFRPRLLSRDRSLPHTQLILKYQKFLYLRVDFATLFSKMKFSLKILETLKIVFTHVNAWICVSTKTFS